MYNARLTAALLVMPGLVLTGVTTGTAAAVLWLRRRHHHR